MGEKNNNSNETQLVRILTVKWKDHVIGYLMKEEGVGYLFKYDKKGVQEAKQASLLPDGTSEFKYMIGFKNLQQTYVSPNLFPVFKSRIPSRQRRDIQTKLDEKEMEEYDEFEYLVKSNGRLINDHITVEEGIKGLQVTVKQVPDKRTGIYRPVTFVNKKSGEGRED